VLGLIGVAFSLVPLTGYNAWLVIILGIASSAFGVVFAALGLLRVNKGRADNMGMSVSGLLISVIGIGVGATWIMLAGSTTGADSELHFPASSTDKHTVEFVVTSTGGAAVHYGTLGAQRTENVPPSTDAWRQEASYSSGSHVLSVTADNTTSSLENTITCSLLLDGAKVSENAGKTIALCTANVG
jgi:hypothetical protein